MNTATLLRADEPVETSARDQASVGIALWILMVVGTCLFALFGVAFAVRMQGADWVPVDLPPQMWLGTLTLVAGGQLLRRAEQAARREAWALGRTLWLAGGACTALFLTTQLWVWHSVQQAHVLPQGHPAAGFFYLLTGVHGLHVLGGLVAWAATAPVGVPAVTRVGTWRLALCARYWHFLLLIWVALFAMLAGLRP